MTSVAVPWARLIPRFTETRKRDEETVDARGVNQHPKQTTGGARAHSAQPIRARLSVAQLRQDQLASTVRFPAIAVLVGADFRVFNFRTQKVYTRHGGHKSRARTLRKQKSKKRRNRDRLTLTQPLFRSIPKRTIPRRPRGLDSQNNNTTP